MSREAAIAKIDVLTSQLEAQLRALRALRAVVSELENNFTEADFKEEATKHLN